MHIDLGLSPASLISADRYMYLDELKQLMLLGYTIIKSYHMQVLLSAERIIEDIAIT